MLTPAPKSIWVVAAALIDAEGRCLMQQRPSGKQHGGLWEFPGGKIEPGETPEVALVRELAEELAITVSPAALVPVTFVSAPPIMLLLFRCQEWSGDPRAVDGQALRWGRPEDLMNLPMPPADRPLLAALARG